MRQVGLHNSGQDEGVERRFAAAADLFQARDAPAAELRLRQNLEERPDHTPSLNLLALIVGRAGRDAECVALLERAIAHGSADQALASMLLLAAAHERAGRTQAAESAYRRALVAAPGTAEAPLKLGLLLLRQGRPDPASRALRDAVLAEPDLAAAHSALASALKALGDLAGAAESAAHAVALGPDDPGFLANLAVIRNAQGRYSEGEAMSLRALAHGDDAALFNTLGVALKQQERLDEAAATFERATTLRPDFVDARYNLGLVRKDQGRTDEAVSLLREVVTLAPDLAAARFALCMAHLPPLYTDEPEIERRRADYSTELDALVDHAARVGAAALAGGVGAAQPFYLAYQGCSDVGLQKRYGALVCRAMAEAFPPLPLASRPVPGARIRVGVICGHIRDHSVWRLPTRGWVERLDRTRFEVIGYHTSGQRDSETGRAETLFDRFVQGPLTVAAWRERIAADQPHALIYPEVGMDPMAAQLAAMRLAPVQYASWGHPTTSGYPTLDYFLSSEAMEPAEGDDHYSEHLVRLPGLSTPIVVEPFAGTIPSRADLGLPPQATVYWCGQSLYKYLPQHDDVFAAIAARAPGSRFLFVEFPGSKGVTARFRARLANAFSTHGLDAEASCVWLPQMSAKVFLAAMACSDVVLDSVGWSGCNSLLDALSHGLPIVTLAGQTMRSRHGAAILSLLGQEQLICDDLGAYVETAVSLSSVNAREAMKRQVKLNLSKLADSGALPALERHIINACEGF
jgi:predicted O-linked N-acetylglucosamine transferase (SPINDLY family)